MVRAHRVAGNDEHARIRPGLLDQSTDAAVDLAVDLPQQRGPAAVRGIRGRPAIVSSRMGLVEHREEQVPLALSHQPTGGLGLGARGAHQASAHVFRAYRHEADVIGFEAQRVVAAGAPELGQQCRRRGGRSQVVRPGAPVDHLAAGEALLELGVRRVEHDTADSGIAEQAPEARATVEALMEALIALKAWRRLKCEVDAVLTGRSAGVDRGPRGDVEHPGDALEPAEGAGAAYSGERRQMPLALHPSINRPSPSSRPMISVLRMLRH